MARLLASALPTPEELFNIDIQRILDAGFWWLILVIAIVAFISLLFFIPPLEMIIYPAFVLYSDRPHLVFGMMAVAIGFELLASLLAHKIRNSDKVMGKYAKKQRDRHSKRLDKWGPLGLGVFAATPLPITFALYYAVALKFTKKQLLIPMVIGRFLKYISSFLTIMFIGADPADVVRWVMSLLGL